MDSGERLAKRELSIAIPASLVSDVPHLREKTMKVGVVARTAAIFCVSEIIIFLDSKDGDQSREADFIATVLSYMETPQYLRKRLFGMRPELRYAGVLPPLRTPHHPLTNRIKNVVDGEYRDGVLVSRSRDGSLIDVGLESHVLLRNKKIPINSRVTVQLRRRKKFFEAKLVERRAIPQYWGYRSKPFRLTIGKLMKERSYDLIIATSKYGRTFWEVSQTLIPSCRHAQKILIAFGAPSRGLYELCRQEDTDLDEVSDFVVNMIPNQGVETVRTEEALSVTLGILNLMAAKG